MSFNSFNIYKCFGVLCFLIFLIQVISAQRVVITFNTNLKAAPVLARAALKYDKELAYSFTFDDASDDPYSCAFPIFSGGFVKGSGTTHNGLFYTDGCGNSIPFTAGLAWNAANRNNQDVHTGEVAGQMTWAQLDELLANKWEVFNHSYSHRAKSEQYLSPDDYRAEISLNEEAIAQKTTSKIRTNTFVVPSGDVNYIPFAFEKGYKAVFNQNGDAQGLQGINVDSDFDFSHVIFRQNLDESLFNNMLDNIATKTSSQNHVWFNEFCHHIDIFNGGGLNFYSFNTYMQHIADTYGARGNDKIWFAPLQEVMEYLQFKKTIQVAMQVSGNTLILDFDQSAVPDWITRRAITFNIENAEDIQKIEFPNGGNGNYSNSNKRIINIDLNGAAVVPVFNCPTLQKNIGDTCTDGNIATENDKIQPDCSCKGTPIVVISTDSAANLNSGLTELKISTPLPYFTPYSIIVPQITFTNGTNTDYTNVKIQFPFRDGLKTGGNAKTSNGIWEEWCYGGVPCYLWRLATLKAHTQATLNVPLYIDTNAAQILLSAQGVESTPEISPTPTVQLTLPQLNNVLSLQKKVSTEKIKDTNFEGIAGIYPNPTAEAITVVFKSKTEREIGLQFFDAKSKLMYQQKLNLKQGITEFTLEVSGWSNGTYFILGGNDFKGNFVKG